MSSSRALRAIWDQVPDVGCRGLCADQCTITPMSRRERATLADAGYRVPTVAVMLARGTAKCPVLSADGRCRAYRARPLICRLYGAAEGLECPHGCRPTRVLTDSEAARLIEEVKRCGGHFE